MRRIAMLIPVLCCLAFVAQQSEARDDDAKDKSKEWVEGSAWEGIIRIKLANGEVRTQVVTAVVTKREGKSFEGRFEFTDGAIVLEFEGEVDVTGKANVTVTKIAKASDEWKKSNRNVVGTKTNGTVDGKSAILKYRRSPGDPLNGAPATGTITLKLKD